MALIDLATYKSLLGIQAGLTQDDAQITALLEPASKAVETYTGRSFAVSTGIATERSFQYDGSGFLDVDDCTAVTAVSVNVPNVAPYVLDSVAWTAMPDNGPVTYYLLIHGGPYIYGISPEMGFERNLDNYPLQTYKPATVAVTATWGWAAVPEDVKLATALTIQNFVADSGKAEGLTAEAIADWSRSWGSRTGGFQGLAVPNRARDLLAAYQRIFT